ncbi:AraC family transcriptional regulator [Lacihabitans sp. LS3-19]|uniref:helix-turn-helix domain-containing protein n=1 Tax=Lacihabitans sp. LS3-19 TaxID=2487335 RepID=UPI0020CD1E68|nr:helix-turn-helix transcriptional regulator [Lacihabitans sp. LS3-19]MCP9770486.1 AraC family transcriptional regulator [Lacihabitans sp. LS3-19]
MDNKETLEEFYKRKFDWIPDRLKNNIGHFNVFKHEIVESSKARNLPYKRRDFYKVMYVLGDIEIQYADRVIKVKNQALFFSNPHIPYKCENLERIIEGSYCIFNQDFFQRFGDLNQYSVFQPTGNHVFELTEEQGELVRPIFAKMFEEINSEYVHKYDVLRNLVFELLHFAMKMEPASLLEKHMGGQQIKASQRISTIFLELVERQYPIDENHPSIKLRSASEFAEQLNVHVNHLNRAVKEITQKTTTQIIAERLLQEAKIMLKQSNWNISEIAYALGFTEVTHFNNFFKKHLGISPSKFRNI